jgi:hypothetical protein
MNTDIKLVCFVYEQPKSVLEKANIFGCKKFGIARKIPI